MKKTVKFFKELIHIILGFLKNRKLFSNGIFFEKTRSYRINQLYNFYYIFKNNFKHDKNFHSNSESNKEFYGSIVHAKPFQVSPLLRFNKLIKQINVNIKDFNFLDLGSGGGILLHFVLSNYNFKSYYGIEFDKYLVQVSNKNLKKFKNKVEIVHNDVNFFLIKDEKYIVYLYNSFDETIIKNFIDNNLDFLTKNECILLYQNDFYKSYIKEKCKKEFIVENGLSIFYF